jgi:hypothetical protein
MMAKGKESLLSAKQAMMIFQQFQNSNPAARLNQKCSPLCTVEEALI